MKKHNDPLRLFVTKKLFLREYLYKIRFQCKYARLYKKYDFDGWVEHYDTYYRNSEIYRDIHTEKYINVLRYQDYEKRVEAGYITVYTNDSQLITDLYRVCKANVAEIYSPLDSTIENLAPNAVVVSGYPQYKFKVVLHNATQPMKDFVKWCKANDKIFISKSFRKQYTKGNYNSLPWLYVADEGTLTMIQLYIGPLVKEVLTIIHVN